MRLPKHIPIKPSKHYLKGGEWSIDTSAWGESPAFAVNPRGILIHRVRHVTSYHRDGKDSHHHVHYLCGNGCNVEPDIIYDVLVADPPEDRLLCDFCEVRAAREELPNGDTLAGRHVHRGVLYPKQTCCIPENSQ